MRELKTQTIENCIYDLKYTLKGLQIVNWNVRHLPAKTDELMLLLYSNQVDLFEKRCLMKL